MKNKKNRLSKIKIVTLFLATTLCFNTNAQVCFNAAATYSLGTNYNPYAIASADFNGDGKLDIALADNVPYKISVFLNTGNGTFGAVNNISVGSNPRSITCADFDGDGNIDIATSDASINKVSVLLGDGAGNFAVAVSIATGNHPEAIVSNDFDGDGKTDIATCNDVSNDVSVLLNTGTSVGVVSFASATSFTVGSAPISMTTADFNGDGKKDIVTANSSSNNVSVLLNTNTITGTASFTISTLSVGSFPTSIINNDFNNDGYIDLAISNWNSSTISVFLNTTTSSVFVTPLNSTAANSQFITSADFNADGKIDIASVNQSANFANIYLGSGLGYFNYNTCFSVGNTPYNITSADLNGDSRQDLAIGNLSSGDISVLLNSATLPTLTVTVSNNNICAGQTTTLTATGASTYTWTNGIINATAFTPSVTATDTVIGTDLVGCTNTAVATIMVNTLPNVIALTNDTLLCIGQSALLTASGANTYTWNTGPNTNTISVNPTSNTTYTVTGTNLNNCSNIAVLTQSVSVCADINQALNKNEYLPVFPNPTTGIFLIALANQTGQIQIEIYNMLGEKIYSDSHSQINSSSNFQIDLTSQSNGIYFINVKTDGKQYTQKIIKN